MAFTEGYRDFVVEQLERVCPVAAKSMFGGENAMGYYEVPVDVLEDPAQLEPWMREAIDVAARAKRGRRRKST